MTALTRSGTPQPENRSPCLCPGEPVNDASFDRDGAWIIAACEAGAPAGTANRSTRRSPLQHKQTVMWVGISVRIKRPRAQGETELPGFGNATVSRFIYKPPPGGRDLCRLDARRAYLVTTCSVSSMARDPWTPVPGSASGRAAGPRRWRCSPPRFKEQSGGSSPAARTTAQVWEVAARRWACRCATTVMSSTRISAPTAGGDRQHRGQAHISGVAETGKS